MQPPAGKRSQIPALLFVRGQRRRVGLFTVQHATPSIWAILALVPVTLVWIALFFKTMTAKTIKAHVIYFALSMGAGLVIIMIIGISGLGPSAEELRQAQSRAPKPEEVLRAVPWEVFTAMALWMIGGNYILFRQRRKAGETWRQALNPLAPLGRYMDKRAWFQTLLLVFVSLAVAQRGLVRTSAPHIGDAPNIQMQR